MAESSLTSNYEMNLDNGQLAFAYKSDEYIVEDLSWFEVYVTDPDYTNGDYLQIHLLAKGDKLPDGVYTINNALTDMTGLKGAVNPGGEIVLSWMSDLSSADSEGVQSVIAPIMGGTVTVTTTGDNTRKLVFDLEDEKGNLINGVYEGAFGDFNSSDFEQARAVPLSATDCTHIHNPDTRGRSIRRPPPMFPITGRERLFSPRTRGDTRRPCKYIGALCR